MSKLTTILWDVDGTLIDFEATEKIAVNACLSKHSISISDAQFVAYRKINSTYWERFANGEIDKNVLYPGRFDDFFAMLGVTSVSGETFNQDYQQELGRTIVLQDYALELCNLLKGRYKQYVVTNGSAAAQKGKLHNSGFNKLMDGIFISEQMGTAKPDKKFFELCSETIPDYCPETTMIIGDSLTCDMHGGNNAGIACCWFNPKKLTVPSDIRVDYNIASLRELDALLLGK